MTKIIVMRRGTIWFSDCYEVDEVNEETIQKCIDDDSKYFVEAMLEYETWEPDGSYEVINGDTFEVLKDSDEKD